MQCFPADPGASKLQSNLIRVFDGQLDSIQRLSSGNFKVRSVEAFFDKLEDRCFFRNANSVAAAEARRVRATFRQNIRQQLDMQLVLNRYPFLRTSTEPLFDDV